MILTKPFPPSAREARWLYLSCLSGIVVLVVFFSHTLWPHFDIHSYDLSGERTGTQTSHTNPYNQDGAIDEEEDEMYYLGSKKNETSESYRLQEMKYAVILPTFSGHMPLAMEFLQSYMCLCTDQSKIDFHVIVSDSNEVVMFQDAMKKLKPCGPTYSIFPTPAMNINGPKPKINIINMFDILPPVFHSMTTGKITGNDTSALLKERGKYQYQTIKKMSAALELDYDYALWLDSEAIAVQPFSMRQTFDAYVKDPTIWRSRMTNDDFMRRLIGAAANVLDRSMDSFGPAFWNLESVEWIFEKNMIKDLVQYVEKVQKQDFWTAWVTHGGPFEVNLLNMHIQARKLETTDSLFTKYRIIETEREMQKYGMVEPAKAVIDAMTGTGLLERGYKLLAVPEIVPNFSSMLRENGQTLFRLDNLDVGPPEAIDRFLLETPINIICSGAPPLHSWWEERKKSI